MNKTLKKWLSMLMVLLMLVSVSPLSLAEEVDVTTEEATNETTQAAETTAVDTPAEQADWTVMLYLCGTDLETNGGMATTNLVEIANTIPNDNVNVVIETGGTRHWQAEEALGIKIATDKQQRWSFSEEGYQMVEERPLANMADYRTLSDFIQWSAKTYPAEKYLLVMWDHGAGSNMGLIVDELHNKSIMSISDMGKGLADAGVHLEAVLLDTCLMATLEMAQVLQPHANYMIASEETVPGYGSAYKQWLQYLYDYPYVDGRQFGKVFCDVAQQKYAELDSEYYYKTLTFSVVDLNKLDPVVTAFEAMFAEISSLLVDPEAFGRFTYLTQNAESFMYPEIVDLQDFATRAIRYGLSVETVGAVIESVNDAVVHDVKGILHSYSHGLAFWYNTNASVGELDHFARNCKNPSYLAFLDAINMGWTAPDWVYEQVERLPDVDYDNYVVNSEITLTSDNHLQLAVTNAKDAVARVDYRLLMEKDNEEGGWISLGFDDEVEADWEDGTFWDKFDGNWPTLGDTPCQIEMINSTTSYTLYNVPIAVPYDSENPQAGYNTVMLRVGYEYDKPLTSVFDTMYQTVADKKQDLNTAEDEQLVEEEVDPYAGSYVIYGIWSQSLGNSNIALPSRDAVKLEDYYGVTFTVMGTNYEPLEGGDEGYTPLGTVVLSEDLVIEEKPLPKGNYAYQFVITDVFGNQSNKLYVPFTWDGEKVTYDYESYESLKMLLEALFGIYY